MTTRKATLFTVLGLVVALVATGVSARESRLDALKAKLTEAKAKLTPNGTPVTVAPPDGFHDYTTVAEVRSVHFDVAKAEARPADAATLDADAAWLKANPDDRVLIAGFADARGTDPYNLTLSQRRALWVRDQLVARGVPSDRIVVMSYGERRGVCRAKNEQCFAENRRADILVARMVEAQRP